MNPNYLVGMIHGIEKERNVLKEKYEAVKEEVDNTFTPEYCATSNRVIKDRFFSILEKHFGEELSNE